MDNLNISNNSISSTQFDWLPFTDIDSIAISDDQLALDLFDAECGYPVDELSPDELEQIERDYQEWLAEKDLFDSCLDTTNWQGDRYYDDGFGLGW